MFALKNKELTASGQVTTKVSAGTNTLSAPARVVGLNIRCGGTLGKVDLRDGGASGTTKFTIPTPAIGSGEDEILQVSNLKPGSKSAKRRKSFCARSAGQMKKFPKAAANPNSRLRQARRRWKC